MHTDNFSQLPFVTAAIRRFLATSLCLFATCPVWAAERSAIDLMSYRSKLTVSCDARSVASSTDAPPRELLEWCVKACEAHGYAQENGFELADVSDDTLPPRLDRSFWPWALKVTPTQCLPYQPVIKKPVSSKHCLEYRKGLTIKGMLASYDGWKLNLKDPSPGCISANPGDPRRWPEADTLNDITLIVAEADLRRFESRIGEQLVVRGRLEYRVHGDTASFNLVDVELLDFRIEPDAGAVLERTG